MPWGVSESAYNRRDREQTYQYRAFGVPDLALKRGLGRDLVERANELATDGLAPDLVLLLDLPVEAGLARRADEGATNHFDRERMAFHERVRAGYLELASEDPQRWCVIDASQALDAVIGQAYTALRRLLTR